MQIGRIIGACFVISALFIVGQARAEAVGLGLPEGRVVTSDAKAVSIGQVLFFAKFPSDHFGRTVSCATCHNHEQAQSGSSPDFLSHIIRSAPPLTNLSLRRAYGWEHNRSIEELIENALLNEMRVSEVKLELRRLLGCYDLQSCVKPIVRYMKAYVLSRKSHSSRFDRYLYRTEPTLTPVELLGLELFTGKARCTSCHKIGADFSEFTDHSIHNIGLQVLNDDHGRCIAKRSQTQCNLFFTPSLRDVSLTAPYMHDGRFPDLRSVVEFYDKGGDKGVQFVDSKIRMLSLTNEEISNIVAFLQTLEGKIDD